MQVQHQPCWPAALAQGFVTYLACCRVQGGGGGGVFTVYVCEGGGGGWGVGGGGWTNGEGGGVGVGTHAGHSAGVGGGCPHRGGSAGEEGVRLAQGGGCKECSGGEKGGEDTGGTYGHRGREHSLPIFLGSPTTMLRTPGGSPARRPNSARASAVSGVASAGFRMTCVWTDTFTRAEAFKTEGRHQPRRLPSCHEWHYGLSSADNSLLPDTLANSGLVCQQQGFFCKWQQEILRLMAVGGNHFENDMRHSVQPTAGGKTLCQFHEAYW